jgi:hypothetical protein
MLLRGTQNHFTSLYDLISSLKVLTNEKRDGVTMLSFDRSPFKLFSPKFSNKLVQASSCERPKTTQ